MNRSVPSADPARGAAPASVPTLYLASQSPRRQELLTQIGISFALLPPADASEAVALENLEAPIPGESPHDYVQRVTLAKVHAGLVRWRRLATRHLRSAAAPLATAPGGRPAAGAPWGAPAPAPILSADTTVALDGEIFGKPRDAADAGRILRALSGREHQVLTAVAILAAPDLTSAAPDLAVATRLSVSTVRFMELENAMVETYIASGEPFGKAGAYGIQGRAAGFIEHIDGSYSGIMGLPLFETAAMMRDIRRFAYYTD